MDNLTGAVKKHNRLKLSFIFKGVRVFLDLVNAFNGDDLQPFGSMARHVKGEQRTAMEATDRYIGG